MEIKRKYDESYEGKYYTYLLERETFYLNCLIKNKKTGLIKLCDYEDINLVFQNNWIPYTLYIAVDIRPRHGELGTHLINNPDGIENRYVTVKKEGPQYMDCSDEKLVSASSYDDDELPTIDILFLKEYAKTQGKVGIKEITIDDNMALVQAKVPQCVYEEDVQLEVVSFELATMMRQLGFRSSCKLFYDENPKYRTGRKLCGSTFKVKNEHKAIAAPKLDQAKKWFRDVLGIHVELTTSSSPSVKWFYSYYKINDKEHFWEDEDDDFDSYELALEDALTKICYLINNESWNV